MKLYKGKDDLSKRELTVEEFQGGFSFYIAGEPLFWITPSRFKTISNRIEKFMESKTKK